MNKRRQNLISFQAALFLTMIASSIFYGITDCGMVVACMDYFDSYIDYVNEYSLIPEITVLAVSFALVWLLIGFRNWVILKRNTDLGETKPKE